MLKKTYPAGPENTAIAQFEIKIPEISQEKWSNTAIPQAPMSPSKCSIEFMIRSKNTDVRRENRRFWSWTG